MKHMTFWFDGKFYNCYKLNAKVWDECKHGEYRELLFPILSDDRKAFIIKSSAGEYMQIKVNDWVYKNTNDILMPVPAQFIDALESTSTKEVKNFD